MAVWIFNVYLKASSPHPHPTPHNGFTRCDGDCGVDKASTHSIFPLGMLAEPSVYSSRINLLCV